MKVLYTLGWIGLACLGCKLEENGLGHWEGKRAVDLGSESLQAIQLSAGSIHTLAAVKSTSSNQESCNNNTSLKAWGYNDEGQLGLDDRIIRGEPADVPDFASKDLFILAAGYMHTCAADSGTQGLWCWGYNGYHELGLGDVSRRLKPTEVPAFRDQRITALAAGDLHTCAAATTGLWCWGHNNHGQLGLGDRNRRPEPVELPAFRGQRITALTAGTEHTCAATIKGLGCWGNNDRGQLGLGDRAMRLEPTEVPVFQDQPIASLEAGYLHTCAATVKGLWCWGGNDNGQLGLGDRAMRLEPTEVVKFRGQTLSASALGSLHTCAASAQGLWCWGENIEGQLGLGHSQPRFEPVELLAFRGQKITALAAGDLHTCAASAQGLWCWGGNDHGQLGLGDQQTRYSPQDTGTQAPGCHAQVQTHVVQGEMSSPDVCVAEFTVQCDRSWPRLVLKGEMLAAEIGGLHLFEAQEVYHDCKNTTECSTQRSVPADLMSLMGLTNDQCKATLRGWAIDEQGEEYKIGTGW